MRRYSVLILALLVWGCGKESGGGKMPPAPPKPGAEKPRVQSATYADSVNGVRLSLPGGWIVKQGKSGLTFMAPTPDDADPAMGYTKPLPRTPDGKLADFKKAAATAIANLPKTEPSAKNFKQESVKVAGGNGLLLSFDMEMEGSAYRAQQVYMGGADNGCLVIFYYPTAEEATYSPVFQLILDSLEPGSR